MDPETNGFTGNKSLNNLNVFDINVVRKEFHVVSTLTIYNQYLVLHFSTVFPFVHSGICAFFTSTIESLFI